MYKLASVPVGSGKPVRIMGIINVSPESFYKKSVKKRTQIKDTVIDMEGQGADFVDVGGMSTAPYLDTVVSEKTESKRVEDAIKIIQGCSNLPISVDTSRASVAKRALSLGAEILNDVTGLKHDRQIAKVIQEYMPSLVVCAYSKTAVKGTPVRVTCKLLSESIDIAKKSGVRTPSVVVDPAIGFFRKKGSGDFFTKIAPSCRYEWLDWDIEVIKNLRSIKGKSPLLVSVSNKSFVGRLTGREDPADRLYGSVVTEAISVLNGADIVRTHNVSQTKDAISVASKFAKKAKSL